MFGVTIGAVVWVRVRVRKRVSGTFGFKASGIFGFKVSGIFGFKVSI